MEESLPEKTKDALNVKEVAKCKSQPNRDYNSNDVVMTPDKLAYNIIQNFLPTEILLMGKMLEPCCGDGAFLNI